MRDNNCDGPRPTVLRITVIVMFSDVAAQVALQGSPQPGPESQELQLQGQSEPGPGLRGAKRQFLGENGNSGQEEEGSGNDWRPRPAPH